VDWHLEFVAGWCRPNTLWTVAFDLKAFFASRRAGLVRLVRETGKPIAQMTRYLEVNKGTLGNWVNADRRRRVGGDGMLSEDERTELVRLRKENAELTMERVVDPTVGERLDTQRVRQVHLRPGRQFVHGPVAG
jgi:transposase